MSVPNVHLLIAVLVPHYRCLRPLLPQHNYDKNPIPLGFLYQFTLGLVIIDYNDAVWHCIRLRKLSSLERQHDGICTAKTSSDLLFWRTERAMLHMLCYLLRRMIDSLHSAEYTDAALRAIARAHLAVKCHRVQVVIAAASTEQPYRQTCQPLSFQMEGHLPRNGAPSSAELILDK